MARVRHSKTSGAGHTCAPSTSASRHQGCGSALNFTRQVPKAFRGSLQPRDPRANSNLEHAISPTWEFPSLRQKAPNWRARP